MYLENSLLPNKWKTQLIGSFLVCKISENVNVITLFYTEDPLLGCIASFFLHTEPNKVGIMPPPRVLLHAGIPHSDTKCHTPVHKCLLLSDRPSTTPKICSLLSSKKLQNESVLKNIWRFIWLKICLMKNSKAMRGCDIQQPLCWLFRCIQKPRMSCTSFCNWI